MEKNTEKIGILGRHFVLLVTILLVSVISKVLLYAIDQTILEIEAQTIQLTPFEIKR